ncbi:hypothetical protein [Rhodococcus indonesiensis]
MGPVGQYPQVLPDEQQAQGREVCRADLPRASFFLDARAGTHGQQSRPGGRFPSLSAPDRPAQ